MGTEPVDGSSALFGAVLGGDAESVARLLGAGAPADGTDEDGRTVLHLASAHGEPAIVELLLAAGADPGHGDELPLCGAAVWGHEQVVRALLAAGADPDAREEFGDTALSLAVSGGRTAAVRALLAGGADPALPDGRGTAPLVLAARRGSPAAVRELLPGADRASVTAALAEARRWAGRDIAEALRAELTRAYGEEAAREPAVRRFEREGEAVVTVELLRGGAPFAGAERGTGHGEIAAVLEGAAATRAPAE
ncbi:ankyrin repeat domain-containing protein [Streptomyces sp. CAU 1734]|uniref:ankyrin repeat domain-containing protein n=1 Tax=Streptomyces sp. CAU 1734 TaxID=3140360 RepID=UPI0032605259